MRNDTTITENVYKDANKKDTQLNILLNFILSRNLPEIFLLHTHMSSSCQWRIDIYTFVMINYYT